MSVAQWPDKIEVLVLESSGIQPVCGFTLPEPTELMHVVLWFRKVGTAGGSERFRLKVFGNPDLTAPLATSNWFKLSDMEAMATQWLGWARFDFARENLRDSRRLYLGIEPDSYTRNGTTFYVSVLLDRNPFNPPSDGNLPPNFSIIGYK